MDYQKAKDIREKSFSDMMVKNLGQGDGIGESFSKTISEKTQARVKGFKQAFDPMQIAKTLTFGSNLAPALLGKLTGRSSKDIKFFSGKRRKSKADFSRLDNSASGISKDTDGSKKIVEVFGLIYRELERVEEDRRTEESENKTNQKIQEAKDEEYEDRRNAELVKALTSRIKPKKDKNREKLRDEKGRFVKDDKKTSATPKVTTPKVETPPKVTTPKVTTPKVETPPKVTAPKVETPNVFKPNPARTATPTKTTPIIPSGPAVAGFSALGAAASAIAAAESGGDYNITFGDRKDKTGKIVNSKGYPTPEELFGKKLTEMTLDEVKEFGRIRSSISPNSGATGKYQFMPTTLFGSSKNPGLVQQAGLSMNTPYNADTQEILYARYKKQNVNTLKSFGIPITPGYEYMAHYIGPRGAAAVYRNTDSEKTVAEVMADANLKAPGKANNPELYKIKSVNFEKILEERLKRKTSSPHAAGQVNIGNRVDASSKENKDLKDSLNKNKPLQTETNNNQSSSTQNNQQESEESADDRPALIRKRRM